MTQQIINNKKFGPIAVGNPTLTGFPKHSNLVDCISDLRVVSLDVLEVRTQTTVHITCSRDEVKLTGAITDTVLPRESGKILRGLEGALRSERNPKPRFRLISYTYIQD